MDKPNKTIYKGMSSIKYLSDNLANDLYALKYNAYDNFIQLLIDLKTTSCDSRQLDILIKLDFFSEFGNPNQLLTQVKLFNNLYGKKQFKKDSLPCEEYLIKKYAGKESSKMYTQVDTSGLLQELVEVTSSIQTNILEKISWQNELLGYISITKPNWSDDIYYVQDKEDNWVTIYQMRTGLSNKIKTRAKYYKKNPFAPGQIIQVEEISRERKFIKLDNGEWGRSDELEDILMSWSIIKES